MEKINIAELLKDCPSGMELDCTIFENLKFCHIDKNNGEYNIICHAKTEWGCYNTHTFTEHGCYSTEKYSKCVIFPKGKTSWEGFVPPYKFKDGDVLFHSDSASNGIFIFKEILQYGSIQKVICYCDYDSEDGFCLGENHTCCWADSKILHPATKEQREILFQKMKEAGYKWNQETKTLEKLMKFKIGDTISNGKASITINYIDNEYYCEIGRDFATKLPIKNQDEWDLISEKFPNKFNVNTLIPFESRVLVRNDESQYWIPAFWGCKRADGYTTTFGWCKYCIPFEGNEHLLETNNDCNEYYKTWK